MAAEDDFVPMSQITAEWDKKYDISNDAYAEPTTDTKTLSDADKEALKVAGAQTVAPIDIATTAPDSNIPDYLKEFLATPAAVEPVDYTAKYKEAFGSDSVDSDATIDGDKLFSDLEAKYSEEQYLDSVDGYRTIKNIVTRQYEAGQEEARESDNYNLIQDGIRHKIGDHASAAEFDQQLAFYAEDGKLNEAGNKWADSIRKDLARQVGDVEKKAKEYGAQEASKVLTNRKSFGEALAGFKALDSDVDADDLEYIRQVNLSGQLDEKLQNISPEERALIAIVLNPSLRAKYFGLKQYERGAEQGAKQKLSQKLGVN